MTFKCGKRTLKTLLAVAFCILSMALLGIKDPFFACIATIFVIQGEKEHSINNAKNRVWGTAIGALISNIVLFILSFLPYNTFIQTLVVCISIFLLIQVANYFQKPMAIFPGCIVICAILCTTSNVQIPLWYGFKRTLHTVYGALIGLGINLYLWPYPAPNPSSVSKDSIACKKSSCH